jgi:hypothetical protein
MAYSPTATQQGGGVCQAVHAAISSGLGSKSQLGALLIQTLFPRKLSTSQLGPAALPGDVRERLGIEAVEAVEARIQDGCRAAREHPPRSTTRCSARVEGQWILAKLESKAHTFHYGK